jgi:MFS family permease
LIDLRQVVGASVLAVLGFGFSETIVFAVVGTGLHKAAPFVGVLVTIQSLGAIVAGPTAAPLVRRIGERSVIAVGLVLCGVGALLEIPSSLPSVVAGVILLGLSVAWVIVGLTTLAQRLTPPELQGRVYAALDALITTPQAISIAAGAALVGVVGYRVLLAGMAATSTLAGAYLLARPRRLPAAAPLAITTPSTAGATRPMETSA